MQYAKLDYLSVISISGVDKLTFLQGQLTADISLLTGNNSCLAAHCNLKGRMVSLGRILLHNDEYLYIVPKSIQTQALKRLQKYAMFSKVSLSLHERYHIYGLSETEKNIKSWPEKPNAVIEKNTQILIKMPGDPNRVLCLSPNSLELSDAEPMPEEWWQSLEIQNYLTFLTENTTAKFLPHEINLQKMGGVSFKKGCFVGQEIIARMEYLGKLKKSLQFVEGETESGQVVCAVQYDEKLSQLILR